MGLRHIVGVDVERYSQRPGSLLPALRAALHALLEESLDRVGVSAARREVHDQGDGGFILVDPSVPVRTLHMDLADTLARGLTERNCRIADPALRLRLRMTVHTGEIVADPHGVSGADLNLASRLLNSDVLREALDRVVSADLVVLVSEPVYQSVAEADGYHPFQVTNKDTSATAWLRAAGRQPGALVPREDCPYQGLVPFKTGDASLFFGRGRIIGDLLARLGDPGEQRQRMLAVVGASGAGKSSLLHAGLLAALERGRARGAFGRWRTLTLTPGGQPLAALADALERLGGEPALPPERTRAQLVADPESCGRLARRALSNATAGDTSQGRAAGEASRLIVVVDQFEELFTVCADEGDRIAFITALHALAAADDAEAPGAADREDAGRAETEVWVVLGLRADFYGRCLAYQELVKVLQRQQVVVGAMSDAEFRHVIEQPAAFAGLTLETDLVDRLLDDVGAAGPLDARKPEPGALPLLSHALQQTWRNRTGRKLTIAGYERSGGLQGAIDKSAEAVWGAIGKRFSSEGEAAARRMLLGLVALGQNDAEDTRRRRFLDELLGELPFSDQTMPRQVLDDFVAARLVTIGVERDRGVDRETVEFAHEALFRAWSRLRDWIANDRQDLVVHLQLAQDAKAWDQAGRTRDVVYRGARWAAMRGWLDDPDRRVLLNQLEVSFLMASDRARRSRIHRTVGVVTVVITALALLATVALFQADNARRQERIAVARQVAATADASVENRLDLAQMLAVTAYELEPTPQSVRALFRAASESPHLVGYLPAGATVTALASSRDGNVLAAGTEDGRVLTWDLGSGQQVAETDLGDQPVRDVALDRRGERVAATDGDQVVVWEPGAGSAPLTLEAATQDHPAGLVALSASGATVAVVYQPELTAFEPSPGPSVLAAYDSTSGGIQAAVARELIAASFLGFTDESTVLTGTASGSGSTWWSLSEGQLTEELEETTLGIAPLARYGNNHAADGSHYVWAADGVVSVCRLGESGEIRFNEPENVCAGGTVPTSAQEALAVSTDGRQAAVAADGTIYLTSIIDGRHAAVAADGSLYLTSDTADAQDSAGRSIVLTGNTEIRSLVYVGSTHRLASASGAAVALWDPAQISRMTQSPGIRVPYANMTFPVPAFALAPDDRRIAVFAGFVVEEGGNQISDLDSGQVVASLEVTGDRNPTVADWSEDGAWIAAASFDGSGWLWDVRDGSPRLAAEWGPDEELNTTGGGPGALAIRVVADQERIVIADSGGAIAIRDLTSGQKLEHHQVGQPPSNAGPPGDAVAVSDDGRRIALVRGTTVELVGSDGQRRSTARITAPQAARQVAFTPDGSVLIRSVEGVIDVWDPQTSAVERRVTSSGRSFQPVAVSPDGELLVSLQEDGVAIVTDFATGERIGTLTLPEPEEAVGGGTGAITGLAFEHQGRTLVTLTAGGTVLRWDLSVAAWIRTACETAGRALTDEEWEQHIGSEPPADRPCQP